MYDNKWYIGSNNLLKNLFNQLRSEGYRIIAPVKKENHHILEEVNEFTEIDLNYTRTLNTPRYYLQPPNEPILKWSYLDKKPVVREKRIPDKNICFFGIHPCDANAIVILDKILMDSPEDALYTTRRRNAFIVIYDCLKSDQYCFCEALGARIPWSGSGDLWIIPSNGKYYVKALSAKGEKMVANLGLCRADSYPVINKGKIPNPIEIFNNVSDHVWEEYSNKCLLCGSCLAVCPTCVCFDIIDHVESLEPLSGSRIRTWNSCIFRSFTTVAGDKVFRSSRKERFRFRYLHKFIIIPRRYGLPGCIGCGRCVMNCPLDIHPLDVLGVRK